MPTIKIENILYFGPNETENILRLNEQRAFEKAEKKKRKKNKKTIMPDPPGSTLCTERSLSDLRARFGLGAVTLRVPSPDERADNPPTVLLWLLPIAASPEAGFGVRDIVPDWPFPDHDAVPETSARDFDSEL